MKSGLGFLLRYVLATSLLFSLWSLAAPAYVASLIPAVNGINGLLDLPVSLQWQPGHLLYHFRGPTGAAFRLEALDHGAVYLNLVTMLALLAATPGRDIRWYGRWMGAACVLLWCTHVFSFVFSGPVALWQFAATGPAAAAMAAPLAPVIAAEHAIWYSRVLEFWGIWGRYGLCLALWCVAVMRPQPAAVPARSSVFSVPVRWALRSTTG